MLSISKCSHDIYDARILPSLVNCIGTASARPEIPTVHPHLGKHPTDRPTLGSQHAIGNECRSHIPGVQSFSIQPPPSYAHAPFPRSMATTSNPVCSFTAQPCSSLPPSFCVCASLSPVRPVVVGLVVVATAFHPSTRRPDAVFVAARSTMSTSSFTIGDTAERTSERTNPPVCYSVYRATHCWPSA